ncbi:MAG: dihydroorotase [Halorhodospira halophila]|uniref:dihydroorotase n=1 Tax=Halorhodospira TaxID=85108 RepID=UPI001911A794|nr:MULTISPECIES: dihydroorotase [Halorhodospira]MBK5943263.1 dihydroorotase [Halorhodospira halophila]MCC3751475.1 dihydroorotase [Halorhodospira halophila]MCG5526785.1 dihydroorotase [Halorhodospira halophila]MCG5533363.1 dihydroorotase [Halorhodospira sp. 9621]MCG5537800.1 dihydroorotase [Halorhodospira sp. 9622]
MSRIHIHGGHVIDPASGLDEPRDVFIADGRILAVGTAPDGFAADRAIDATGQLVLPGLVDLAARLREPGATRKGGIVPESRAAAAGGITTLLLPPDTRPAMDTPSVVELVHSRAQVADAARVRPLGALTRELDGEYLAEMAALRDAGCPAVCDGGRPVANTLVLRRALDYAATFSLPVVLTPEDPSLADSGRVHEGETATRLGLPGQPAATETAAVGRILALVEESGNPVHLGRLSTARAAAMVAEARRAQLPVTADVAIHQLLFTEQDCDAYNTAAHVRPPLRTAQDRDGLRRAVAEGAITAICSDHQPHDPDAKICPFADSEPGVSGVDTLLGLTLRLVDEGLLSIAEAVDRVTLGPARALGLEAGTLTPGAAADVAVVDPRQTWRVTPESLHSRGRNSLVLGQELAGRATATLVAGRIVYPRTP